MKDLNKLSFLEVKKFLQKKGFKILYKKDEKSDLLNYFKNFYYTAIFGFIIVSFFFFLPIIGAFTKNFQEVNNNSKSNLEKLLSGKPIEKNKNEELNSLNIFQDVLEFDDISQDTVRLSASVIEQIFKDTNYNILDVRKNKIVKPISLSLLPNEIKKIENIQKRKNLFIQIILPLILAETNQIKIDRNKLFTILNKNNNSGAEKNWLKIKLKQYGVKNHDLSTLKIRMDEVPTSLAIAQAAKETGWGTSRFALEGNALFGQWTYSGKGIKPLNIDSEENHKVMKFKILKASIRAYYRNLNTHSGYKNFRKLRAELRDNEEKLDSLILVDHLDKYAATGKEYTRVLKKIISQNSLKDFDDVKLLPTSRKLKNLI
jgi:Bax protein